MLGRLAQTRNTLLLLGLILLHVLLIKVLIIFSFFKCHFGCKGPRAILFPSFQLGTVVLTVVRVVSRVCRVYVGLSVRAIAAAENQRVARHHFTRTID